jgi:hypothetical protein
MSQANQKQMLMLETRSARSPKVIDSKIYALLLLKIIIKLKWSLFEERYDK